MVGILGAGLDALSFIILAVKVLFFKRVGGCVGVCMQGKGLFYELLLNTLRGSGGGMVKFDSD